MIVLFTIANIYVMLLLKITKECFYEKKRMVSILIFALIVVMSQIALAKQSETSQQSPIEFAKAYMRAQLEALKNMDVSYIEGFFSDKIEESKKIREFEEGRLEYWIDTYSYYGVNGYVEKYLTELISQNENEFKLRINSIGRIITGKNFGEETYEVWNDGWHYIRAIMHNGAWVIVEDNYEDPFTERCGKNVDFDQLREQVKREKQAAEAETQEFIKNASKLPADFFRPSFFPLDSSAFYIPMNVVR